MTEHEEQLEFIRRTEERMIRNSSQFLQRAINTDWNEASLPLLKELDVLFNKYRNPRLYVESMETPWLDEFKKLETPGRFSLSMMDVIVAPILSCGDLPPGLYKCGRDFFAIDGRPDAR